MSTKPRPSGRPRLFTNPVKITVTVDQSLLDKLDAECARRDVSRNLALNSGLRLWLAKVTGTEVGA